MSVKDKIRYLKEEIAKIAKSDMQIMEVCGTHTMGLAKHGIRAMLPSNIKIISGPGCPVCVSGQGDIGVAINLAKRSGITVATFGDMLKVPSKGETLLGMPNVKVVYSPMEALAYAKNNKDQEVVFLGIGFETTAPLIAATIVAADRDNVTNFSVFSVHKTVPEALKIICSDKSSNISNLLLPGHVSAITGSNYFEFLRETKTRGVIAGFDPLGIMESIYLLVKMFNDGCVDIINNLTNVVTPAGNEKALALMDKVFKPTDSYWRGIGMIPRSGLEIRLDFSAYDAKVKFDLSVEDISEPDGCRCGDILMGKIIPPKCVHFGKGCTPLSPIGPCMVSSEGTCAAYYKYNV